MQLCENSFAEVRNAFVLALICVVTCLLIGCGKVTDKVNPPQMLSESQTARLKEASELSRFGFNQLQIHDLESAQKSFAKAYAVRKEILGPVHSDSRSSLLQLAQVQILQKHPREADKLAKELEASLPNAIESDAATEVAVVVFALADLHAENGEDPEAKIWQQRAGRMLGFDDAALAEYLKMTKEEQRERRELAEEARESTAAFAKSQHEIFSESVAELARAELQKPLNPDLERTWRALGYTESQIQEMVKLIRQDQEQTAKYGLDRPVLPGSGSTAAASAETLARLRLPMSTLTNFRQNPVEMRNEAKNRNAAEAQSASAKKMVVTQSQGWAGNPGDWYTNAWDHWQSSFETGLPLGALLTQKAWRDPFMMVPMNAATNGSLMVDAVLNLKGLLSDREFRLRKAMSSSADPIVGEWNRQAMELEMEAITNRPAPVSAEALEKESKAFEEVKEWARKNNPNEKEQQKRLIASGLNEHLMKHWGDASQRQYKATSALRDVRKMGLRLKGTQRPSMISSSAICSALPKGTVLVDYVRMAPDPGGDEQIVYEYAAAVLSAERKVEWVRLGDAKEIESSITKLLKLINDSSTNASVGTNLDLVLQQINHLVWRPLERHFPIGTSRVLVCPDAALQMLPFSALRNGRQFQAERFQIVLLSDTRSLLRSNSKPQKSRAIEIWCNPDFGEEPSASFWSRLFTRTPQPNPLGFRLDSVGSTAIAAQSLRSIAIGRGHKEVHIHEGANATEQSLLKVNSPWILHLGTHGFIVRPPETVGTTVWPTADFPFEFKLDVLASRTGIALAGARRTLYALPQSGLTLHGDDGVLTPAEALTLNLEGTKLVTLSACYGALGAVAESEGLLGLRSALISAGAEHVVSALWELNESYANEFTERFYKELFRSNDPIQALSAVQAAELVRLANGPDGRSFCNSVRLVGPWTMTIAGVAP